MQLGSVPYLLAVLRGVRIAVPRWLALVPPYVIGSAAMYWLIQRVAAF